MLRFIVKRSAFMLLMVAGLLAITFTISHVAPGDPAWLAAGPNATEAMVQTLRAEYGMDKPVVAQFGGYLAGVVQGDLGRSITTTRPVFQDLLRYFPRRWSWCASPSCCPSSAAWRWARWPPPRRTAGPIT